MRERVERDIKMDLILDAIAEEEEIEVSDEEVQEVVRERVELTGGDYEKVYGELKEDGRLESIRANKRLAKALDLIADTVIFEGEEKTEKSENKGSAEVGEGEVAEERGEAGLEEGTKES